MVGDEAGAALPLGRADVVARPPGPDVLAVALEFGDQGANIGVSVRGWRADRPVLLCGEARLRPAPHPAL
jgi:hypothetical protein